MMAKIDVNGPAADPLYQWLTAEAPGPAGQQGHQVELHQVPGRQGRAGDQALRTDRQARRHGQGHRGGAGGLIKRAAASSRAQQLLFNSASSSTSTQCRTGVAVPLCRCVMQPMLAEMIACGCSSPRWPSLRSRSWVRDLGLQHRVGAGRAAAQVRFASATCTLKPSSRQVLLDAAAQLAGRAAGCRADETPAGPARAAPCRAAAATRSGSSSLRSRVSSLMRCGLGRVGRVVLQVVAVFLDGDAAARRVHHDRLDPAAVHRAATRRRCWRASGPGRRPGRSGGT